ncbi:EF-P 5-aminopentanol modification-associated protein YfmH [Pseudalkalibacillus hwajinpoensis]|uniref:Insulinase family protein n=1 Tax=Guptibacillus hwajinpoensis TaxID=208199 RepID=A0A4U1MLQ0_9BACL|nr:pitrilysin family protein [Pseudalkalibacillus hwajinpoensis]TKD71631.1 insulinase family protein [Pseudalkalibacillus hwajinpoensis]
MKTIPFNQLQETLYHQTMDNGLDVYVLPKKGFNKTYATFTTKYGSVDNHFVPLNGSENIQVPDGIAHFLEHKLFEKEDRDVFQDFSKQGASSNAFTSFTRTAYLFSTTQNVMQNLETLVNFVQDPYFSDKSVEKEKGIIGQEIEMYNDNSDWRAYFGVIENMFHHHPVKIDIAGTVESIAKITKESLYTCYETFYHPSNMVLFVVGAVEPNEIMSFVEKNQAAKSYKDQPPVERFFDEEPKKVAEKKRVLPMSVQVAKCLVGFKEPNPGRQGEELLKHELSINLALDLMFGQSSENYETLYNEGLIDQSFSYDFTEEEKFGFSILGSNTSSPDELADRLYNMIQSFKNKAVDEEQLERIRKKKIGSFLRALNSPEFIANQFTRYRFNQMDLFEVVPVLEALTAKDVEKAVKEHFAEECFTVCQVVPKA